MRDRLTEKQLVAWEEKNINEWQKENRRTKLPEQLHRYDEIEERIRNNNVVILPKHEDDVEEDDY